MSSGMWITPEELDGTLSTDPGADEACSLASFVLWAFSGRKYGRARTVTETYECACSRPSDWYMPARWPAVPVLDGGAVSNVMTAAECGCQGVQGGRHTRLRLRGTPVRRVHRVRTASGVLDPSLYRVENSGLLTLSQAAPGDVCGLEVTYTYGTGIPGGGRLAAKLLAQEFVKSWSGDDECRLPDRVTNVSRQGVSFTVLDKQDFLDDLRTGILEVDLFLRAVNPDRARKKARVFSPDLPKAHRTTANFPPARSIGWPAGFPRSYDLLVLEGADLYRGLRRYGPDGEAIDLTGWSFRAEARASEDDGSALVVDLTPFLSVSSTDTTLLDLSVPEVDAAPLWTAPAAAWDLWIWPTGDPSAEEKWLSGAVVPSSPA